MNMKLLVFFCCLAQVAVAQSLSAVLRPPYTGEGACCTVEVAQSAATSASPDSSANVQTGTADPGAVKAKQLIDQMIQTLGGDAYLRFTDVTQEGRTNGFYHGTPSGGTAPFWRFYKFPDKERVAL